MRRKILIIEDEATIRGFIRIGFQRSNYIILEAESGEEGLKIVREQKPDIVILDIMLPGMDGFEVCRILREEFPKMGIIILTARNLDMDKIMGLEYGADDYMVKPFNPLELVLRAEGVMRRINPDEIESSKHKLESGLFSLDLDSQKVWKNDVEIETTPKEYQLMRLFIENPGKVFSREQLLSEIWGYEFIGDSRIVDVHIRRLRKK
jgi:Transcriptional regulatory protein, C terminal./Response regulator receiver domain.